MGAFYLTVAFGALWPEEVVSPSPPVIPVIKKLTASIPIKAARNLKKVESNMVFCSIKQLYHKIRVCKKG